jgi:hypothetical protein
MVLAESAESRRSEKLAILLSNEKLNYAEEKSCAFYSRFGLLTLLSDF